MSVSCPETIFFSPKWRDSGCGFFRVLTFQEHKLLTCQEPGMLGVGNPFSEKMFQKHRFLHGLGAGVVHGSGSTGSTGSSGSSGSSGNGAVNVKSDPPPTRAGGQDDGSFNRTPSNDHLVEDP